MFDEKVLKEWMRGDEFPRELSLSRIVVNDWDEARKAWKEYDEYFSVFSLRERFYEQYNTMFWDIDGKSGGVGEAYTKLQEFVSRYGNFITRLYFSGVGFHAYTDFTVPVYGKKVFKSASLAVRNQFGLGNIIDNSTCGDVARMARTPLSTNSKSGNMMIELDRLDYTLEEVLELSSKGYIPTKHVGSRIVFDDFGVDISDIDKDSGYKDEVVGAREWVGNYPPCVENAKKYLVEEGELNHRERLHLASFLIAIGEEAELWEVLKKANDFSYSISKYQVEYLKANNMKPLKCSNVPDDICSYAGNKFLCPFYPSVNATLNNLKVRVDAVQ